MNIIKSTERYDAWLTAQLKGDVFQEDIEGKHDKMAADAFQFLRATYWRWAETIFQACPELETAPKVVAVGDIHVENFGTWRDLEGRVIWGVNDFDEAAEMPYIVDLVRLAVSAVLADVRGMSTATVCRNILKGYRRGLKAPAAFVLDQEYRWLRKTFVVDEAGRADFWRKMTPAAEAKKARRRAKAKGRKARKRSLKPAPGYRTVLNAARPDPSIALGFWYRTAGTGSLGRPRWVGRGNWHDSPVVREAKAIVPSGWTLAHGRQRLWCGKIAFGRYRSGDPWYRLTGSILVRRLSPNNRKLELDEVEDKRELVNPRVLRYMGRDLAAIHLGIATRRKTIEQDLARRGASFAKSVREAVNLVRRDQGIWREARVRSNRRR